MSTVLKKTQSSKRQWEKKKDMHKQSECRSEIAITGTEYSANTKEGKVPCCWGKSCDATLSATSFLKVQLKWQSLMRPSSLVPYVLVQNFIENTLFIAQHIVGIVYMFIFPLAWIPQEQGLVYSKY